MLHKSKLAKVAPSFNVPLPQYLKLILQSNFLQLSNYQNYRKRVNNKNWSHISMFAEFYLLDILPQKPKITVREVLIGGLAAHIRAWEKSQKPI